MSRLSLIKSRTMPKFFAGFFLLALFALASVNDVRVQAVNEVTTANFNAVASTR